MTQAPEALTALREFFRFIAAAAARSAGTVEGYARLIAPKYR